MTIVWDDEAKSALKKALVYIKKDSEKAAEKVRLDLLEVIGSLLDQPKRFPSDKFKIDNNGNYRAFEKHNFRVAYLVTKNQIRILRIRHVRQEPLKY